MKIKIIFLFILIMPCSIFFSTNALIADIDSEELPDEILIDNDEYKQNRKGPVLFSHLSHAEDYDVSCEECHHDYYDGENAWKEGDPVIKCIECHDPTDSDDEVKKLKIAYHRNCIGCHKNVVEEEISEDAPRTRCYDCHEK